MHRTRVYLGTHRPAWLAQSDVPLFVSRVTLDGMKRLPRARAPWALDSGGFSELQAHGRWTVSPEAYVEEVRRYAREIGRLEWAAIQDWMCEPVVIAGGRAGGVTFAGTGLSVEEHQRRTVASYRRLLELAPEIPWAPVVQGWAGGDHVRHVEMYEAEGFDLTRAPIVGVGSICRRQATMRAGFIIRDLADLGLRLHGFGFKKEGLRDVAGVLASSDSLAWSYSARRNRAENTGCPKSSCNNCLHYAREWLAELHESIAPELLEPFDAHAERTAA
jgi:hypothetical protein